VDTKNAASAYFCKEWKGLYCRNLGLILSYVDVLLYGFVDYTAKNHFLIKKKILNLRNYFLKRETDFLNKKKDS
jgi:hypothetical protein